MKISKLLLLLFAMVVALPSKAIEAKDVKQVKNLIVLIPDGTSLATVSMSRYLQWYRDPSKPKLHLDPYLCGTVRTTSSNAPIGDSAPTTSCYMTGHPSRTGFVSTYPPVDAKNDLYPFDTARAYQPMSTILEAAKQLQGKSTGLVFTCQFPHATPADCSAHSYNRNDYYNIADQMAHNDVDVVIGGGVSYLTSPSEAYLKKQGFSIYKNDIEGMRSDGNAKMWALYCNKDMNYDIDRDPSKEPSLEEMTRKALDKLSTNANGFFLMVEGSKVDWAAHANDPVGMASDMLAFDRACGAAIEFARKNGNTAVVILPDHGNSGISIGRDGMGSYDTASKDKLFEQFSKYTLTSEGLAEKLNSMPGDSARAIFRKYEGLELTDDELTALNNCKDYKGSPIPKEQRKDKAIQAMYSGTLTNFLARLLTKHTYFGFTHYGHTGEDVFLAVYHPDGTIPVGMNTNIEINHYLCNLFGLTEGRLDELSYENFSSHKTVFKDFSCTIIPPASKKGAPTLVVKNKKNKKQLTISAFTNIVKVGKKSDIEIALKNAVVYVDKNNTFYLAKSLADALR